MAGPAHESNFWKNMLHRKMKIEDDLKLDFNNVLIKPQKSKLLSRNDVNIETSYVFKWSRMDWNGVPIFAANMDSTGTFEVYDVLHRHKIVTAFHKFYGPEDYLNFCKGRDFIDPNYFAVSIGMGKDDIQHLKNIADVIDFKIICIDIANGYLSHLVEFCKSVRSSFPNNIIIAGNVVTGELVDELITNGRVDIVKIGIGPGSACTTRLQTGVGMPQLSAIIECAEVAHRIGGHIIGDGGITCPGDMAKAFGGGADFVMAVFAGHYENPGEVITENGNKYKLFYGMSSKHAMEKHFGTMKSYRSSEGRCVRIPLKGKINDTVLDYLGGLRSACTYINAESVNQIAKCTTFIRVAQQLNCSLLAT